MIYRILATRPFPFGQNLLHTGAFEEFRLLFLGIVLEALPFILLGVILSAVLQLVVTEQMVQRFIPRNPAAGILYACLLGLLFPVCECGMIPIIRRLMRKGMPAYIATVFILAGPVLNPITYGSTYMAFSGQPEMAYGRMGLAFVTASAVGLLLYRFTSANPLRHSLDGQERAHTHPPRQLLAGILGHASDEFFEMGKYLILGAGITAFVQAAIEHESLRSIGQGELSSHLFMAGLAYVLSLCSTSDAFVAASFSGQFSMGSLLTFLVLGPMIDFKGTLMLLSVFKTRFVLILSAATTMAVLLGAIVLGEFL
jgi:uncharacterized membrane protein YraQ (UPF0718 family)